MQGSGQAEVIEWSPNRAVVSVREASPGALLVYNMNYDPSWRADGDYAIEHASAVATRLTAAEQTVEFHYFPRTFKWSLPLFGLTLGLCVGVPLWWRRRKQRRPVTDQEKPPAAALKPDSMRTS